MTDTRVPSERAMASSSTWVAAAAGTDDVRFGQHNLRQAVGCSLAGL